MRPPPNATLYERLNRFTWLMDLYADNYLRLAEMLDFDRLSPGIYFSEGRDDLLLRMEVQQRHNYTLELTMSYTLRDTLSGSLDPTAMIRVYLDSKQCEVSHCYVGRRWQDVLGIRPSPAQMVSHRLRMNGFFNKWLQYLKLQGHQRSGWFPAADPALLMPS